MLLLLLLLSLLLLLLLELLVDVLLLEELVVMRSSSVGGSVGIPERRVRVDVAVEGRLWGRRGGGSGGVEADLVTVEVAEGVGRTEGRVVGRRGGSGLTLLVSVQGIHEGLRSTIRGL